MRNSNTRITAVALAAIMLMAGAASVATAAPGSIDGSQTDTANETYVSPDKTMDATFNASGDGTWNMTIQSVPDGADLAMNVSRSGSDTDAYSFSGAFSTYNDTDPDATATTGGRYVTFSNSELDDVPAAINENVTLNVTYWNESASNPTPTTVQVYVENTDERTVGVVKSDASFVETKTDKNYVLSDENHTSVDDTRKVNGSNTTVVYTLGDKNASDSFANATDGLSNPGTFTLMQADASGSNTEVVPVYYKSAPSWYNMTEHGSYAVYDPDKGTVTYTLSADNFDGRTQADIGANTEHYSVTDVGTVFKLAGGQDNGGYDAVIRMANPMTD